MLGNPKWFKRRKYTGWGLTPATWQGWAYMGILICSIGFVSLLFTQLKIQMLCKALIMLPVLVFIVIDSLDIAFRIDK